MHMYANDMTLHLGVSHPRAVLPDVLAWVHEHDFPAESVTTLLADWDDAPSAYAERTTKLVLHRPPRRQSPTPSSSSTATVRNADGLRPVSSRNTR
jgi:hypothetical protein